MTRQSQSSAARLRAASLILISILCVVLCAPALATGSVRGVATQHLGNAYDAVVHSPFGTHGTSSAPATAPAATSAALMTHGYGAASNSLKRFVSPPPLCCFLRTPTERSTALAGDVSPATADLVAAEAGAGLRATDLTMTRTVERHLAEYAKDGRLARPYADSRLTIQEIMDGAKPIPDPGGAPGALRWDVTGTMNGSSGTWELVVNPETKTILHFLFNSAT